MVHVKRYFGIIKSAELAQPLKEVSIEIEFYNGKRSCFNTNKGGFFRFICLNKVKEIIISKEGFIEKKYSKKLPKIIRLLENHLIGYQDKLSFNPGEHIDLYVNSKYQYKAELYRHGLVKEFVLRLGTFDSFLQQVPDKHFVEYGVGWQKNTSYVLPDKLKSGIYSLMLTNTNNEKYAVPMIISSINAMQKSDLLVLASNTTWQSYNIWGGRSRYRNFEYYPDHLFSRIKVRRSLLQKLLKKLKKIKLYIKYGANYKNWVFQKLSIQRPFTNCQLEDESVKTEFTNHLAGGEWRLIAWLEKENYDFDVIAGIDLHTNNHILEGYKAIILSTHSEYWSDKMYDNLERYHKEKGLWIINLGGNSIYRQIEFFNDQSTRCISLEFHKSHKDEVDLLGVRFTVDDYGTAAPYQILEPQHWLFNGIETKFFGLNSLNTFIDSKFQFYNPGHPGANNIDKGTGASGWETDKVTEKTSNDFIIVAKGMNKNGGADMVYRAPMHNKGGVFSASSIMFGASLLIDASASLIINNLLKKVLNDKN
jgi:hypothetical protein